jgi:hypothetical protein
VLRGDTNLASGSGVVRHGLFLVSGNDGRFAIRPRWPSTARDRNSLHPISSTVNDKPSGRSLLAVSRVTTEPP